MTLLQCTDYSLTPEVLVHIPPRLCSLTVEWVYRNSQGKMFSVGYTGIYWLIWSSSPFNKNNLNLRFLTIILPGFGSTNPDQISIGRILNVCVFFSSYKCKQTFLILDSACEECYSSYITQSLIVGVHSHEIQCNVWCTTCTCIPHSRHIQSHLKDMTASRERLFMSWRTSYIRW